MPRKLQAETQGKGTIIIDLDQCKNCPTKACAGSCPVNLIRIEGELPVFSKPAGQVKRLCMDCLACELECSLQGRGALRIFYRMPQLEEHLRKLEEKGVRAVWRRG